MKRIHEQSLEILETIGMNINHRHSLEVLADAGARLENDSTRVPFPPEIVEECLKRMPSRVV